MMFRSGVMDNYVIFYIYVTLTFTLKNTQWRRTVWEVGHDVEVYLIKYVIMSQSEGLSNVRHNVKKYV